MDGHNLRQPRPLEWGFGPDDVPQPCVYCKQTPIELQLTNQDGKPMTSRWCRCSRQWFEDRQPVTVAHALASLPRRLTPTEADAPLAARRAAAGPRAGRG